MSANHTEIVLAVDESRTKTHEMKKHVHGSIGKPVLPYALIGEPQSVEGACRNTPPKALCFESYAMNTGDS